MRNSWMIWEKSNPKLEEMIFRVEQLSKNLEMYDAVIGGGDDPNLIPQVRTSKVAFVTEDTELRNFLYDNYILPSNRNGFGFDVQNFAEIQYTEYYASDSGHYDWHADVFWNNTKTMYDRKLSLTIQLSNPDEYEGGDFEFQHVETPTDIKKKGTVLVFPSYLYHRVTPVTRGLRKSLVAWFEGPYWK